MKTQPERLLYYILYMLGKEPYTLDRVDTPEGQACLFKLQRMGGTLKFLFTKEDLELLEVIEALGIGIELTIVTHIKNVMKDGVNYKNHELKEYTEGD